jgi:ATP-dependent 26S proteasome regulatory subunit
MVVLATNFRENIDPAFMRRLEFVIEFEEPGPREREALWRCHLPSQAPIDDQINLGQLANLYPVVGGVIRNAAVAAGFMAAADGGTIGMGHLVRAIRREYEKSGRPFPGTPFGVAAP